MSYFEDEKIIDYTNVIAIDQHGNPIHSKCKDNTERESDLVEKSSSETLVSSIKQTINRLVELKKRASELISYIDKNHDKIDEHKAELEQIYDDLRNARADLSAYIIEYGG
jgi:gas vesicle protein